MFVLSKSDVTTIAEQLSETLSARGVPLKHVPAMNAVSAALGFRDPNAMTAALRAGSVTVTSKVGAPEFLPANAAVGDDAAARHITLDPGRAAARLAAYLSGHRGIAVMEHDALALWDDMMESAAFGSIARLGDEHGLETVWTIDEVDDMLAPHPFVDAGELVYDASDSEFFGGNGTVIHVPLPGPRWLDLWIAADRAVRESGDLHHRFIEDFVLDGVNLVLHTGS